MNNPGHPVLKFERAFDRFATKNPQCVIETRQSGMRPARLASARKNPSRSTRKAIGIPDPFGLPIGTIAKSIDSTRYPPEKPSRSIRKTIVFPDPIDLPIEPIANAIDSSQRSSLNRI